jgi:hypothetical protein
MAGLPFFKGLSGSLLIGLALVTGLSAPMAATAQEPGGATRDDELAREDEIAELKHQLAVVAEELDRLRMSMVVPEEPELMGQYGLGPGASRVYGVPSGISIGGYAEAVYTNQIAETDGSGEDEADFLRMVLYFGYKFTDKLLFNTEIEIEHATTSGLGNDGSVSVELASLEYLYRPELAFRGGLLLVPMGFVNEVHEPPFFYSTARPEPETQIIPSTWRENGVGIFGDIGETISYRAYVMNGFDATGFDASGLRGGRQKGERARANDLAFVGRVDFRPCAGCLFGGSYYVGNSGQEQSDVPDVLTQIWELHAQYERGPLHLRALYTQAHLDDTRELSLFVEDSVASLMIGGYAEIAYDLFPLFSPGSEKSLSPFFRFEYLDTQHDLARGIARDRTQPRRIYIPGIQFKPHPNVVLKLDYRNIDTWSGREPDELRLGMGLVF